MHIYACPYLCRYVRMYVRMHTLCYHQNDTMYANNDETKINFMIFRSVLYYISIQSSISITNTKPVQ